MTRSEFKPTLLYRPTEENQRVCVVGLGYIGLPTASILASNGYQVHGVDIRDEVVKIINRGEIHIHEPNLDRLVSQVVSEGKLTASTQPQPADVFLLCVPTPVAAGRQPDLSYVESAARAIAPHVKKGNLIILESTSPPGTTIDIIGNALLSSDLKIGTDISVAYCPERVLPGRILQEAVENDRVVGGVTATCAQNAKAFYETFVTGEVLSTNAVTAELVKLVENSYRDVNIAFANELSMLAEQFSADAFEIIDLANRHPRVNILTPGPGVGGHCISVDPWFLVHAAPDRANLIRQAREVNETKPDFVVESVANLIKQHDVKVIGCLGLAYKADVDDLRESPSLEIVHKLRALQIGEVLACDPYVREADFDAFPLNPLDEVLERSDLIVLLTDHSQFVESTIVEKIRTKIVVDTRGTWRNYLSTNTSNDTVSTSESEAIRKAA